MTLPTDLTTPGGPGTLVSLGDLQFSTDGRDYLRDQAVIGLRSYEGWGPVADATETFTHPSGDGTISGTRRRGARTVVLRGDILGRSPSAALEALDRLEAARGTLVIDERVRLMAREADVRFIDLIPERVSARHFRYALTLHADDPLRYSTESLVMPSGSHMIANPGTADARPVLDVVGPTGTIAIAHPRGTLTLQPVASGVTRFVDLRNGEVWQAGARVHGAMSGSALEVPAGASVVASVSGVGSGTLRARRFGAWP